MHYISLLPSSNRSNNRVIYTLVGSVLFHVAVVGGAYLWPYHPTEAPRSATSTSFPVGDYDPQSTSPEASPSTPEPEPPLIPPVAAPDVQSDNALPEVSDPEMVDPTLPTPEPVAQKPAAVRVQTRPLTNVRPNGNPAPGVPGTTAVRPGGSSAAGSTRPATTGARWSVASKPAYPYALRAARLQGSGTVRITTDASGHVMNATIVQSTGNSALDDNTCRHARSFWSGPANSATNVPFTYQIP